MRNDANPLSGLPVVVKNLLLINVIAYLLKFTGLGNFGGVDMDTLFGLHYFASPLFKPWQLVTHMFMHGGFGHLFVHAGTALGISLGLTTVPIVLHAHRRGGGALLFRGTRVRLLQVEGTAHPR
jgi:hypothetical protein